jgi:hypothetical protein
MWDCKKAVTVLATLAIIAERKRRDEPCIHSGKLLEVVTSVQISLIKASHMAIPKFNQVEIYNLPTMNSTE